MMKKANHHILTYYPPNSEIKLEVLFAKGSVWLTKDQIVNLIRPECCSLKCIEKNDSYNKRIQVSKHISEQYDSNYSFSLENTKFFELDNYRWFITTKDRQRYYNLDTVLAITGQFNLRLAKSYRKWAEEVIISEKDHTFHQKMSKAHLIYLVVIFVIVVFAILTAQKFATPNDIVSLVIASVAFIISIYDKAFDAYKYIESNTKKRT